jgi:hypothetical protein
MTFATADEIQQWRVLLDFLANFRHLSNPQKKTECESYIGRIFVKRNSRILPDFEGKEIMKLSYLNNKFQQAQRNQDSFLKKILSSVTCRQIWIFRLVDDHQSGYITKLKKKKRCIQNYCLICTLGKI